jgi:erythromycin esterase-like protein
MAWRRTKSDGGERVNDAANLSAGLARIARPLETARDLDPLLDLIADARFVLLGEASHGTSEFYTWRTEISKRLIQERGFSFIAVEGDWPDCYRVNRYVKAMDGSGSSTEAVLHAFERWPTWMWANRQVIDLVNWMCHYNRSRDPERRIGINTE